VFKYTLPNGSAVTIDEYASVRNFFGKMVGGICMASPTVLKEVRIIHTNGNTVIVIPRRSKICTIIYLEFLLFIFLLLLS
jgi:hypothetical protein